MNEVALRSDLRQVDWEALADIYRRAPLGTPHPEKLRRSYENCEVCCFAFSNEELVGAGRAISDGETFATVCDLVVAPDFQHQGIGRAVLRSILQQLAVPKVLLACIQGQEEFYRKEGFLRHKSVMALYENHEWFVANGYLE